MRDLMPRSGFYTVWEKQRHTKIHWLVECFAEMLGVFFYTYAGVGSTAAYIIGNIVKESLSSLLQIGFAYAVGIMLAITICSGTSGGHFNPCITIAQILFRGFPPLKGLRYIVAQILGGYIACILVYYQYKTLIDAAEGALEAAGLLSSVQFTPNGTGGILALYVMPGSQLGRVFLNEFVTDFFLGMVIWGAIDPTNAMVPPSAVPFVISMAYAAAIWGFVPVGLAANAARDVGGRLAAISIYGTKASGGTYAALAALTNIPATLLAILIYELFFRDSDRVVPHAQREFLDLHRYHARLGQHAHELDSVGSHHGSDEKEIVTRRA